MEPLYKIVYLVRDALANASPHPTLIFTARYVIAEFDRRNIPDWVAALAGGNDATWDELVDEVRHMIAADDAESAARACLLADIRHYLANKGA